MAIYASAVIAEREGRMNDALRAYRTALRKDDNVDKLYHKLQQQQQQSASDDKGKSGDSADSSVDNLVFTYERTLQLEPDYERQKQLKKRMLTENYVERLLASFRENPYIPEAERKQRMGNKGKKDESSQDARGKAREGATKNHGVAEGESGEDVPLIFHPRTQLRPIHITKLPDELLLYILSFLTELSPNARSPDMCSLERSFALVSRKARILTLQAAGSLFKPSCLAIYRSPLQIDNSTSAAELCSKSYANDWRLMWIEQPRIRTDGVYISQITYVRRGALDSMSATYYDPTHCVTYYRYLCFLPSGDVVSLLSHDIPSVVVPNLLASSKARGQTAGGAASTRKHTPNQGSTSSAAPQAVASATLGAGYTVGRWRLLHLSGGAASSEGPSSRSSSAAGPSTIVELSSLEDPRIASRSDVKYSFKMVCRLKSTVRGKNNKLEMLHLLARNQRTGDESPIPIKSSGTTGSGMPSFYFSRVLSYD